MFTLSEKRFTSLRRSNLSISLTGQVQEFTVSISECAVESHFFTHPLPFSNFVGSVSRGSLHARHGLMLAVINVIYSVDYRFMSAARDSKVPGTNQEVEKFLSRWQLGMVVIGPSNDIIWAVTRFVC